MVTKDNNAGLLSKVAKFVRNPTTNWADLDKPVVEADSGYSKQALKEMIERKRRNDFVRKREFDQLRKLRNQDPAAPIDVAGRPSFFQSSMPSNVDERAGTLKKIDEIEAQMSKQWWKGKQIDGNASAANFPVSGGQAKSSTAGDLEAEFQVTQPAGAAAPVEAASAGKSDLDKTQMAAALLKDGGKPAQKGGASSISPYDGTGNGFSTSKLFAVELSDEATDPELEEASIRFANGDDTGAETGLREALERTQGQSEYAEIWIAALFDLYRATGQQSKFDALALDFAAQLGRSAPAWRSMKNEPDPADDAVQSDTTKPQNLNSNLLWEAPAVLDLSAMGALHLALSNAASPWLLNWSQLREIHSDALKMLGSLFAHWCAQPVRLQFEGAGNLERVLRIYTPSGVKETNDAWWHLRMDAMRVMHLQDEFELVALDYCVTHEVSPPSWQDPACKYLHDGISVGAAPMADSLRTGAAGLARGAGQTELMSLEDAPANVLALSGEILGDAADVLRKLEASRSQGQGRLVVSCATLIRVDFSAAGSILNWVANRQEEGHSIQFRDVHRLVGAFFNVIGINEHAKVVLRAN